MDIVASEPIDACTARRLSETTGINRAYIHFWFGGKTGLLRSAEAILLERIAKQALADGQIDIRHPDIATASKLSAYLCIHDPEFVYPEPRPVIEAVRTNLVRYRGLSEDQAELVAKWFVGSLLAANVFDAQLDALKDLERFQSLAATIIDSLSTRRAPGESSNESFSS